MKLLLHNVVFVLDFSKDVTCEDVVAASDPVSARNFHHYTWFMHQRTTVANIQAAEIVVCWMNGGF